MQALMNAGPAKVFKNETAALQIANEFNADPDEEWTYTVELDPKGTGKAIIRITDEDGFDVGTL